MKKYNIFCECAKTGEKMLYCQGSLRDLARLRADEKVNKYGMIYRQKKINQYPFN